MVFSVPQYQHVLVATGAAFNNSRQNEVEVLDMSKDSLHCNNLPDFPIEDSSLTVEEFLRKKVFIGAEQKYHDFAMKQKLD